MIKAIFRAISYGHDEAKIYIPFILQLPKLMANQLTKEFNDQLDIVPEWMFISYISQILSSFDFESECYLDKLIKKLAKKYPNALFFPFKLSRDNSHHIHDNQIMEKPLVNEINELVSSPIMNKFTSALQCLVIPEKLLDCHFQNFRDCLNANNVTHEKYEAAVQDLCDKVFKDNNELKGVDFGKIKKEFQPQILKLKEYNWDKQRNETTKYVNKLAESIYATQKRRLNDIELRKLCNWMAEYKWSGDADYIEIPGQYTGDVKPFVENHTKIVRFEQRLKIFSSKQLPIEIQMHGSDGKIYKFIVKYGEDLRQDQRIQQVMKLMSEKLSMDQNCRQNRLKIETYQVVPINSVCGMLQTVSNSVTISDFMEDISKQFLAHEFNKSIMVARMDLRNFLLGDNTFSNWTKTYENAMLNRDRKQLTEKFVECEKMIPKDIFQYSLRHLALTLESYYILRKNFVTSLCALNIAHWVLGIGDRHLSNILMDTKNCKLVGIDFGTAFGTAAVLGRIY